MSALVFSAVPSPWIKASPNKSCRQTASLNKSFSLCAIPTTQTRRLIVPSKILVYQCSSNPRTWVLQSACTKSKRAKKRSTRWPTHSNTTNGFWSKKPSPVARLKLQCSATSRPVLQCRVKSCRAMSSMTTKINTSVTARNCWCPHHSQPPKSPKCNNWRSRYIKLCVLTAWHESTSSTKKASVAFCATRSTRFRGSRQFRCTQNFGKRPALVTQNFWMS